MSQVADDLRFMLQALSMARLGTALTSPNPQVGCVLVRDGIVLSQGTHLYAARDHAEIAALKQAEAASVSVRGATAYVTLEPCSHHGRTGPCADALIAAGIARCVVATADPNPQVSGRGLRKLGAAGIEVTLGPLEAEARALNDAFAWSIQHQRPFVTLKAALSVDGFLAPAATLRKATAPHWLTGPAARAEVQRLRHASDALVTGIGTVLADDPALTDRTGLPRRQRLLRVVLDRHLRTPLDSHLVREAANDLLIFSSSTAEPGRADVLRRAGAEVIALDTLDAVLAELHRRQILSVLLEAGPGLNGAWLAADLVDRVLLFYSETELGPGSVPFTDRGTSPFLLEQSLIRVQRTSFQHGPAQDACVSGLLHDPWAGATIA